MPVETSGPTIEIKSNEPLKSYTTFKIGGPAKFFAKVRDKNELHQALEFRKTRNLDLFILGGGSNILVSDHGFDGQVIHMAMSGLTLLEENNEFVVLQCGAGATWDEVVEFAVTHGWWGIENLSHIPGQAGAALVQNIGAYGQQVSDNLLEAEVMDIQEGKIKTLAASECEMGYRRSLFNSTYRGRYVILHSILQLAKQGRPCLAYPDLERRFQNRETNPPNLFEIREAIIQIRDSKFPFPHEEKGGNAGSFFKNVMLSEAEFLTLKKTIGREFGPKDHDRLLKIRNRFPSSDRIKVPTAFLLDICGFKGYEHGRAKVNEVQPLVVLNLGGATASDVLGLAKTIRQTVFRRTGIQISLEPELIGFTTAEVEDVYALE